MATGSTTFELQDALPLPATLSHDATLEFEVSFRPDQPTSFAGEVAIEYRLDTGPGVFVATMSGRGALGEPQVDEFEQPARFKIDLLWVIDDGMSMALELPSVRQNVRDLAAFYQAQGIDYHFAITTTDMRSGAGALLPIGAAPEARVIAFPEDPARVADHIPSTTGSSASQGLDAISAAFGEPLASGANRAFYRQGAVLNVIVVSDRDDRSAVAPQALIERLGARYGGTNLASISAVVGAQPGGCASAHGQAAYAPRYIETARQSGGIVLSICAPAWARAFEFSGAPFGPRPRFYLTHQPVTETLRIFVDDTEEPATKNDGAPQWSYDYATNTINFTQSALPEPGARIRVTYSAECL